VQLQAVAKDMKTVTIDEVDFEFGYYNLPPDLVLSPIDQSGQYPEFDTIN